MIIVAHLHFMLRRLLNKRHPKEISAIATQRLDLLKPLMLLELTEEAFELSEAFLKPSNLPPKASNDALHIALATVYGLDYLLTWNFKHMANAQIQRKLAQISFDLGYVLPVIAVLFLITWTIGWIPAFAGMTAFFSVLHIYEKRYICTPYELLGYNLEV
jgi:hypothetical protein